VHEYEATAALGQGKLCILERKTKVHTVLACCCGRREKEGVTERRCCLLY
jgi:hypothetical protein